MVRGVGATLVAQLPKVFFFLIFLNKDFFYPGETVVLRIKEIPPKTQISCSFQKKEYPVFFTSSDTARVLIGLPGNLVSGEYELIVHFGEKEVITSKRIIRVKEKIFPEEKIVLSEEKSKLYDLPENEEQLKLIREKLTALNKEQIWQGKFSFPVNGKISSVYGAKRENENYHKGVDISSATRTPILAPNEGKVALTGNFNLQGKTIILDHGQGILTLYYHLSSILVKEGEKILKGQKIGEMGSTGVATASHLHWGLYIHSEAVDPLIWTEEEL